MIVSALSLICLFVFDSPFKILEYFTLQKFRIFTFKNSLMDVQINIEALQSYVVEKRTINFVTTMVMELLNKSSIFSVDFEIEQLKFGTKQPIIQLVSMKDIDATLQWHLNMHEYIIPALQHSKLDFLKSLDFQAPFQAVIGIDCQSDCSISLTTTLSLDMISPGCVKFPIHATLSKIQLIGQITIQYLGDSIILFFETPPNFDFDFDLVLGADEKLFDQIEVRGFISETLNNWIQGTLVHPNATKLPISDN